MLLQSASIWCVKEVVLKLLKGRLLLMRNGTRKSGQGRCVTGPPSIGIVSQGKSSNNQVMHVLLKVRRDVRHILRMACSAFGEIGALFYTNSSGGSTAEGLAS